MTLVEEYLEHTKNYKAVYGNKTLVLMQVGSFYECYAIKKGEGIYEGSNIVDFAQINDMVIANKNTTVNDDNVVMAGFGLPQLDKYVKRMLNNGYTVIIFAQDLQMKNTSRSLMAIYSPGTYFDSNDNTNSDNDNLNSNTNLSNNTLCLWIHYSKPNKFVKTETLTIGLNIIDILTGKLINYEYSQPYENSPTTYDQLEKYISIYNPSEVIIISNKMNSYELNSNELNSNELNSNTYIDDVISYANINAQKIHKIYLDEKQADISKALISKANISKLDSFEKIAANCEKQVYQETLIDKIFGAGAYRTNFEFQNYSIANQSLCFLIDFIDKHNPSLIKHIDFPCFENINSKLILANHSLKQLNMISDQRHNGKLGCVANFLNNCITNAGKRKFNYDLLHPICDNAILNASYDVTDHLLKTQFYKTIREYLLNVRDIEKIDRKLVLGKIEPRDFASLYNNLSNVSTLFEKITCIEENKELALYIGNIINYDICEACNKINNYIASVFELSKLNVVIDKLNNNDLESMFFINKNYSENLNKLYKRSLDSRQQLEAIAFFFSNLLMEYEKSRTTNISKAKAKAKTSKKEGIEDKNSDYIANPPLTNDDAVSGGYIKFHETSKNEVMLITTKRRGAILKEIIQKIIEKSGTKYEYINYTSKYSKFGEIIEIDLSSILFKNHGSANSNIIVYSTEIDSICYDIQNSREQLIEEINSNYKAILCEFKNIIYNVVTNSNVTNSNVNSKNERFSLLGKISQFIALSDVCYVKAYNALKYNYCRPVIDNGNGNGNSEGSSKSYVNFKKIRHCLIEQLNTNELYVTNDLEIGTSNNGLLLYGTNAVGKTSFIKSIGIALIMAQAGMFVPCEEFTYYPYEYLFTRLLGNDNIFKGLSTFAVEMCELRTILKNANNKSIILGDELCSGTESTSALSIFVSSLERLHSLASTFLFATHFHEILEYEEVKNLDTMKIYHMSVLFDREQKTLIYNRKLREGPGQSMYGLEVCKSLDLPEDFIERAYAIRNKYNKSNVSVLEAKKSRYNANKLRGMCELCNNNEGTEIHHLQYQKNAKDGIINGEFNKNHKANLINICEACHNKIHSSDQEFRITKTTNGYKLLQL
jgi:DNA mismatch repair protein MutS